MPPTRTNGQFDRRPTLPSIHTLNLPLLSGSETATPNEHNDNSRGISNRALQHGRNFSTSSSATNDSRSDSRSPSPSALDNPANPFASGKAIIQPCTLAEAELIFFAGPNTVFPPPEINGRMQLQGPTMLIFGPNIDDYRNNPRPLPRGSKVHPYRIIRSPSPNRRRPSLLMNPIAMPPRRR